MGNAHLGLVLAVLATSFLAPSTGHAQPSPTEHAQPLIDRDGLKVKSLNFVTYNVAKTAQRYAAVFGVRSWEFADTSAVVLDRHSNREKTVALKTALGHIGKFEIRLIQPANDGDPLWDFLAKHGVSLHHIGFGVLDRPAELVKKLSNAGYDLGTTLHMADGSTRYIIDTEEVMGVTFEFESQPSKPVQTKSTVQTVTLESSSEFKSESLNVSHVGVVVRDADKAAATIAALFKLDQPTATVPRYHRNLGALKNIIEDDRRLNAEFEMTLYKTYFAGFYFEILEPTLGSTRLSKLLAARGPVGQHMWIDFPEMKYGAANQTKDYEPYLRNEGYIIGLAGEVDEGQPIDKEFTTPRFRYIASSIDLGLDIELNGGPRRRLPP